MAASRIIKIEKRYFVKEKGPKIGSHLLGDIYK